MGIEELKPEEAALLSLVQEYKATQEKMALQCSECDAIIKRETEIRNTIAQPYLDNLADIEARIRTTMLDYKHTFISSFGTVNYRNGAVRRTWNLDALDQICNAKPEVKNEIWAFRKETIGEPSISIKIEGE
jgi:hypothetical protein